MVYSAKEVELGGVYLDRQMLQYLRQTEKPLLQSKDRGAGSKRGKQESPDGK